MDNIILYYKLLTTGCCIGVIVGVLIYSFLQYKDYKDKSLMAEEFRKQLDDRDKV
jgi:hypothetical protein